MRLSGPADASCPLPSSAQAVNTTCKIMLDNGKDIPVLRNVIPFSLVIDTSVPDDLAVSVCKAVQV